MSEISSLRSLVCYDMSLIQNATFTSYPGARACLKDLSELYRGSDICPEFFYQLSKICHNIQVLRVTYQKVISNGLADLISTQQNLKYLCIFQFYDCENLRYDIFVGKNSK